MKHNWSDALVTMLAGIPLAAASYMLSIGPAVMILESFKAEPVREVINKVYTPVNMMYEHVPASRKPLELYISLWL